MTIVLWWRSDAKFYVVVLDMIVLIKMASLETDMDKKEARAKYRAVRDSLPESERTAADEAICAQVLGLEEYLRAQIVLTYLAFRSEIETRELIQESWARGKVVALPRCADKERMTWHIVGSLDALVESSFGVLEPPESFPQPSVAGLTAENSIAIVPGLAFDEQGYRLGYGGGYYDRFLADYSGVSVGLCRRANMATEALPLNEYDLPVDIVVTDTRVLRP